MAVVKADAYGHGAVQTAETLKNKVDWFGVANVREGIELRSVGIKKPILILGVPDVSNSLCYSEGDLTAVVSDFHHFDILPKGTRYHLHFDTGMGRLGFYEHQAEEVLEKVQAYSHLNPEGVMTHFATADRPGSEQVRRQWQAFNRIQQKFPPHLIRHVANTGGAVFYDHSVFDMVRFGIGLYGYPPGEVEIEGLQPAMIWKSHLAQVKPVKKGMTVSYLARWKAPYDGYLGVIPVGYGDGYPRNVSGGALVSANGKSYLQVGIVTMDYIMIFLDQDCLPVNTEVTIMGDERNTAADLARLMGSISYEILCRPNYRVERVYIK